MPAQQSSTCDVGWKATPFRLRGTDGKRHGLEDAAGPAGTVVMFICNHCPYVKAILDRLVVEAAELQARGIGVVAIMPNDPRAYAEDSFDNMKRVAARHRFTFPYLIDETQDVARAYGAVCTPDFFGFNKDLELQYRGRLDSAGREAAGPGTRRELFDAMVGIAATGRGPAAQVASIGCAIKWRES